MGADAVFISYSHDSLEHSDRVLALANALSDLGLEVRLDQFEDAPEHGWPHWCEEQLRPEVSSFVVVICTPTSSHYGLASKALQSGKHAFVEKPLTITNKK